MGTPHGPLPGHDLRQPRHLRPLLDVGQDVEVLQATGSAPGSVVATLRYAFTDGRRYEEKTSYSLVDDGGVLKIDRSSVLSSRRF